MENIALRIWQILYTFVLRVENNTLLIWPWYSFLTDTTKLQEICQLRKTIFSLVYNILQPNFAILLRLGCSF